MLKLMFRDLFWNLFAKPSGPGTVQLRGKDRAIQIELTQTEEGKPAKVTVVRYEDGKKVRFLAKGRVRRG